MNTLLKPNSVSILLLAPDHLVVGANVREGDQLTAFLLVSAKHSCTRGNLVFTFLPHLLAKYSAAGLFPFLVYHPSS